MRHPRGAPTLLMRCLLTGRPDGGPLPHSLEVAGGLTVTILASSNLPSMCIGILTTCGSRFGGGGVKGDSQPQRLTQQLHCLLVWCCWPAPGKRRWLADGWCHLRSLWCWPAQRDPYSSGPSNGRPVWQNCGWLQGRSVLQRRHVPNRQPWRRQHISRHTSLGGTWSGHSIGGGGHPIHRSLLHKLTPRHGGSQLRDSCTPTARSQIATVVTKPYSGGHFQQLEQGNHLEAQIMAQSGWQHLKACHHVLDQGSPTQQIELSEVSWETSLRNCPPNWRRYDKEGAGSQGVDLLWTQRGELLERSSEGTDIPPSTLLGQ